MQIEEAADLRPDKGEVIVKLFAAGVNPVDTYIRSGLYALSLTCPTPLAWTEPV